MQTTNFISSSNFWYILLFFLLGVPALAAAFYYFNRYRRAISVKHSLDFSLYEVSFPRASGQGDKPFKELVSVMEQFYAGMAGVKPYYTLELVSPATENETNFYVGLPRKYFPVLMRQVQSLFTDAEVREERIDYNVFKYNSLSVGAVILAQNANVYPVKTYDQLDKDPLDIMMNVFSSLPREKEGAAMQIVVDTSSTGGFKKEIETRMKSISEGGGVLPYKKEGSLFKTLGRKTFSEATKIVTGNVVGPSNRRQEGEVLRPAIIDETKNKILNLLAKKGSKLAFKTNIRLVVSAETEERAEGILEEMKSTFLQFYDSESNGFAAYDVRGRSLRKLLYDFSFRNFNPNRFVQLNTAELTGLFHFPFMTVSAPGVKFQKFKKAEPPVNLSPSGILLGKNNFRDKESKVYLADNDRRRHLYVVGQTGTGKSVLMKNMLLEDIKEGKGVCYIDPHGQDIEDVLGQIPQERWEDVIYFNPGDTRRPLALNMLEYDSRNPEQKTFLVNELLEIFDKLYDMKTAGGPMFEQYFRNAALLVMDDPTTGSTLLEIARVLSDAEFRRMKLSHSNNLIVKKFWTDAAEKAGGEASLQNMVPYITSKFDTFLANDIMRPILCQEKSSFNLRDIMDGQKILLINLSKGRIGETNAYLLGMILIGRIFMAAMSRGDIPEQDRKDFYLYIDEFQNVTTKSISMILSEARKYCLNLIVAHQFIGQLEEGIKKSIFGNVGSMAAFRIGNEDAEFLATYFQPVFIANDLMNIPNYNACVKLLVDGQTSRPFNILTFPPEQTDADTADKVRELSAVKYGRSVIDIEEEISRRYLKILKEEEKKEEGAQPIFNN